MNSRIQVPLKLLCAGLALAAAFPAAAEQATAVLMSGRSISGEVIGETERDIQIRTPYGDLTFRKMDLKDLQRNGTFAGSSASAGTFSDPSASAFGAQPAGGFGNNPFGGAATADPFGSQPSGGAFGSAAPADPFGGGSAAPPDPFGGAASANPFGGAATTNPFGGPPAASANPFGGGTAAPPDPFGAAAPADPFGDAASSDPFGGGPPAATTNPFGGGTASTNPFGGGAAPAPSNPFGGAAAPSPFGGAASSDPFGGAASSDPFGGVASANPFGGAAAASPSGGSQAAPAASAGIPSASSSEPAGFDPFGTGGETAEYVSIASAPSLPAPPVPFSWDAVLFGLREGSSANVVAQPGEQPTAVVEPTNLRSGAIVDTDDLPVRVVFKNGKDVARIAPISRIRIVESSPESIVIELERGGLWLDLAADGTSRRVVVRTNTAMVEAAGGGSFRVADALDHGVHLAVVEGDVQVRSAGAQMTVRMEPNKMVIVRPDGAMTQQAPLNKVVAQEFKSWETLAADWWEDMRTMIAETNPVKAGDGVTVSGLQSYLKQVSKAFGDFAQDTGHVPTDLEGFSVLAQNSGNWERWRGPYWTGLLPPVDCWGRPMRYKLRAATSGSRAVGIVYSLGPDQRDNEGDPAADVSELILYHQLGL